MADVTLVHCMSPNGIVLRLHDMVRGEFGSMRAMERARVTLKEGTQPVDAEFMKAWMDQNGDSLGGIVSIVNTETE